MKKLLVIVATCLFCISCGIKDDPEYKSQINNNKTTYFLI